MASMASPRRRKAPLRVEASSAPAATAAAMINMVRTATAMAMAPFDIRLGGTTAAGSGRMVTAAMAVKCMPQMARVSRPAPIACCFSVDECLAASSARAPSEAPVRIDATT